MTTSDNPNLLASNYFEQMKKEDIDVRGFNHNDLRYDYISKSLWNKVFYKVHPKFIYQKISNQLNKEIEDFKPDILWIFKGMEILPETLVKAKSKGIKLVNYNLDHPFVFHGKGSGNYNILNSNALYDLHFSYSLQILKEVQQKIINSQTYFLPFGYTSENPIIKRIDKEQIIEIPKVCFIGNPDENRAAFISAFAESGLPVDVYGFNWNNFLKPKSNLKIFNQVSGNEYYLKIRAYRVQLNIFRPHNYLSHNMRSFEIPAVGGIMLAPESPEHLSFFEKDKEAFYYNSVDEAVNIAKKILSLSKQAVSVIRKNTRQRSIKSGYSFEARSKEVLHVFESLLSST